jgi:hypothetical protein
MENVMRIAREKQLAVTTNRGKQCPISVHLDSFVLITMQRNNNKM